jgi:hypothetical protein
LRSSSYGAVSVACAFHSSVLIVPAAAVLVMSCHCLSPSPSLSSCGCCPHRRLVVVLVLVVFLVVGLRPLVPVIVVVVVVCPLVVVVVLSRCFVVVAPLLFRRCVLPAFAVPVVSTPRTAARGGGVLVAVVVFASPSLVPAPLPLSSDVALFCCPDPSYPTSRCS